MSDERSRTSSKGVYRLMYRSRNLVPPENRPDELGDLFAKSRSDNKKRDITGALLASGGSFVQVLEGDEAPVRSLFASIQRDPRHTEVEVVVEGPVGGRTFEHWSMAEVAVPDSALPLIAQLSEIHGGRRGNTAAQERLLAAMRDALDDADPEES